MTRGIGEHGLMRFVKRKERKEIPVEGVAEGEEAGVVVVVLQTMTVQPG